MARPSKRPPPSSPRKRSSERACKHVALASSPCNPSALAISMILLAMLLPTMLSLAAGVGNSPAATAGSSPLEAAPVTTQPPLAKQTDSSNDNSQQQQPQPPKQKPLQPQPQPHQPQPQQEQLPQPPRRQQNADSEYLVGVGISDITGPAADINLMGYAKPNQDAGGIHLRQFSRTIVIEDKAGNRILYNAIDNGMISQLLRIQVLERLRQLYGEHVYNESNVMMSASHSHSCPGGFFQYMLYNIPSAGFISQTLEALVDGIERSVQRATSSMRPAKLYYNEGELLDASVNRSPTSYERNPIEELRAYKHNTDKGMYLLKVVDGVSGEPMAMLNWFAVHGTSMNSTNHLISSDNKGYASILFEQEFNPPGTLPGKGKFVAIFAQANEGDVSPNTRGPRCVDSGLPCDSATSTCGNPPRNEKCIAFGPGKDMFESTKIIAYKQYFKARQLFLDEASQQPISGPVRFVHEHIDMSRQEVPLYKSAVDLANRQQPSPAIPINATYHTCPPGLGYSFAAGTTDGPGAFDFQQGDTASTRYWNMVRDFLRRPSPAQMRCHHPKPILLSTGEMDFPYMWHPRVVPTQILMVGQLAIAGLPGEFTSMAGRRVRNAVRETLRSNLVDDLLLDEGGADEYVDLEMVAPAAAPSSPSLASPSAASSNSNSDSNNNNNDRQRQRRRRSSSLPKEKTDVKVVLSGLSNIYTSYVTTLEEYEAQRYEGASTLYGPHTLQAYINQFARLADRLASSSSRGEGSARQSAVVGAAGAAGGDQQQQPPRALEPPDLSKSLFTLRAGVIYDGAPHGRSFGDVLSDADPDRGYKCRETVSVSFVAGNPRNDLRQEDSFLYVDRYIANGTWETVATDASWETKFIWERTNTIMGESRATVVWELPADCRPGVYRIRHYGAQKSLLQTVSQYSGKSTPFKVVGGGELAQEALNQLGSQLESAIEFDVRLAHEMEIKRKAGAEQNGSASEARPTLYSALGHVSSWFGRRLARLH